MAIAQAQEPLPNGVIKFTILVNTSLVIITIYMYKMYFHNMTYMTKPRGHEIYNLGKSFLYHNY